LGEDLSAIKTAMKGDWPAGAQQALPVSGGKTIVDIPTMRGNYGGSEAWPICASKPEATRSPGGIRSEVPC
jgi:hypothetical protein